jgi:hypothetical protein
MNTADGVVVGMGGLSVGGSGGGVGGRCVFSVTDVPPSCRVEVMQSVGAPPGRAVRVFQSEESGLSRGVEVSVENEASPLYLFKRGWVPLVGSGDEVLTGVGESSLSSSGRNDRCRWEGGYTCRTMRGVG